MVIFLPPYRPELNAIEQAWAVAKNFVARNNSPSVTFADLLGVIERGFMEVTITTWSSLDKKVKKTEMLQLSTLLEERKRQTNEEHPDLVFNVGASSSSDDSSDSSSESDNGSDDGEEEILQHLEDGLSGGDTDTVPEPSQELEAAAVLLSFMEE